MPPVALDGSYLVLETTNRCSLACVHCTVAEGPAHPHHARDGFLPLATAEALFADLVAVGARFSTLILFWLGEPLIHPDFGAIYQAALRAAPRLFDKVELHTNATHLARDRIRVALNLSPVPQVWHFSLDAARRDTYRQVKGRDELERVEANLEAFLDARAQTRARWPRPVFQFIVGENNEAEVSAFRTRWEEACRRRGMAVRAAAQVVPPGDDAIVFFRQLDAPTPDAQERANHALRRAMAAEGLVLPEPQRTPTRVEPGPGVCACVWKSPVVAWDGTVTTCTRDNRLQNVLGNVHQTPFTTIWWGADLARRRARIARGDYGDLAACRGCFIPRSANYTDITPAEIGAFG